MFFDAFGFRQIALGLDPVPRGVYDQRPQCLAHGFGVSCRRLAGPLCFGGMIGALGAPVGKCASACSRAQ